MQILTYLGFGNSSFNIVLKIAKFCVMYLIVRLRNSLFAKIVDKPFKQIRNTVTYQCIVLRALLLLCGTEKNETSKKAPNGKTDFF